jgi:putative transposase
LRIWFSNTGAGSRLPTLWTNSYFVATVGGAILEVVKRYVENQRNV